MQGNNQAMVCPLSQGSFLLVPMEGEIESILTPQAVNLQCPLPKILGVESVPNRLTYFSRYSTGSYTSAMTVFHTLFSLDSYSQKRQISHISAPPSNRLFVISQILGDTWPDPTKVSLFLSFLLCGIIRISVGHVRGIHQCWILRGYWMTLLWQSYSMPLIFSTHCTLSCSNDNSGKLLLNTTCGILLSCLLICCIINGFR